MTFHEVAKVILRSGSAINTLGEILGRHSRSAAFNPVERDQHIIAPLSARNRPIPSLLSNRYSLSTRQDSTRVGLAVQANGHPKPPGLHATKYMYLSIIHVCN